MSSGNVHIGGFVAPGVARAHPLVATAAVAQACLLLLGGCGTSPPPADAGTPATSSGAPTVTQVPADQRLVTVTGCQAADGGAQATGTATNPGDTALSYPVTVYFTTAEGVLVGTGQTQVLVPPQGDVEWSVSATFSPVAGVRCLLPAG